ncbi:hypothetical protein K469DRAFT_712600 [Zopfia rhizophila CBS 207.26]|uniref:Sensor histidine kinase-like protein/response regulator n=1 Tax=Zopfia rhizophila CBS 207.26 TaxID=1314779 RepID=A0A6A6ES11_9PEZI|nr:hypothetical protein K469DRAFT_712600 [Zopfia rhizophila CBS 207.26]
MAMMDPRSPRTSDAKVSDMAATDWTKEREFYRYYLQAQRPKTEIAASLQPSPLVQLPQAVPVPPSAEQASRFPSDDKALTAFAQLGALRLNTRRCLISFFDRKNCYVLAEATRTLSLQTGQAPFDEDNLAWGTTVFPKGKSICNYTVNLPLKYADPRNDDLNDVTSLIVNDLSLDERFKNYPLVVGPPHSRFYAGVPIRSPNGHNIGTYCVLDENPRDGISATELAFLKDMAITVMRHLEMTRATDDHRRGGVMVRSLGSFAEGKSSSEDWWQDPWEAEPATSAASPENVAQQRQRRRTVSNPNSSSMDPQEPVVVNRNDSIDSSAPSVKSPNPASPESGPPGSAAITPASEIVTDTRPTEVATKSTATSTGDGLQGDRLSPEVKATFSRAANMILEATEADGAVFFDASVSTFGGLVDDEFAQEQADPSKQDKPCVVLGASLAKSIPGSDPNSSNAQYSMTEGILRHLLRTYPRGQIFNFDEDGGPTPQSAAGGTESEPYAPFTETLGLTTPKKAESSKSQDDELLLRDVFTKARSLVLYPLWDAHRERWFAGAIIWSSDPMRVFTSEQELSFLVAFGNSAMAEVARLDTKLADDAKGDFISSISHELRSPLHGILGSCELLKDTQIDAFQSNMALTIETCGKTLLDTINHVLDYAKINNLARGTSKRQKKPSKSTKHVISPGQAHANDIMTLITDVDLGVLTEEVLETVFAGYSFQKTTTTSFGKCAPATDVPPIAVILDINRNDNYVFRTQPGAWRRVLMNLFGNALKYTQAGFIKVKLQVTQSDPSPEETSEVRLTITDSGIGMSQDYIRHRLWHSFAQEDPLSQGTGLGLSIVKQIVRSLGGDIDVLSEKGLGTKFTVSCPLKVSMLSPGVCASIPDKEFFSVTKRTAGMNVTFIGFDDDEEYFPVKNLKNKTATDITLNALKNLCTDWFGMKAQKHDPSNPSSAAPDLFMATEAGAKWLRAQYGSNADLSSTVPVVVVCEGAASAQSTIAITAPGQIFECISQPCGPHKLAKALTSCLDRHANRTLVRSAETDATLAGVETLSLKDNKENAPPHPHSSSLESPRPPLPTALSAPAVSSSSSSPTRNSTQSTHKPLSILAVDDNPINLRLLQTFITKLKHAHTLATNGLEAVSLFKSKSASPPTKYFDVVLMDINMPQMDGLEATRQIRSHEREEGLSPATIIALTGVASAEAQREAFTSGINLFLIKPVRLAELEVVLRGVVTGEEKRG